MQPSFKLAKTSLNYSGHRETIPSGKNTHIKTFFHFIYVVLVTSQMICSQTTHMYAMTMAELDQTVMRMLYESYGMDEKKHSVSHSESTRYLLRMLSYRRQQNGEANTGFVSHTDKSFMSILHQNHVGGLQLKTMTGQWVGFNPSPTRFVVLSGMGLTVSSKPNPISRNT